MSESLTFVVTGVSSGIGQSTAQLLRQEGHRVIGFDIVEPIEDIEQFVPIDLNDSTSILKAADAVSEPLDGLCNNAGLPPRAGIEGKILQVNFFGQRLLTNALLPRFNNGASIVNMASRAGQGWRNALDQIKRLAKLSDQASIDRFVEIEEIDATRAYNLSKEALIAWTLSETEPMIARNIRINALSPGAIATGIIDDFAKAFGEQMARNVTRAGRAGKPEEVAAIAAFLLSPASGWIKGADIFIDGGIGAFGLSDTLDLSELALRVDDNSS